MRRFGLVQSLSIIVLIVLSMGAPGFAELRDAYVGDVAIVAWLDGDLVKVALANESATRKSITISSQGWDQRWRPFFLERTVVVPAQSIIIEAFTLSSTWRGEALVVEASAWDRKAVVEVQTAEIFKMRDYVVRAQDEVNITVDLAFLLKEEKIADLIVDEYYQGLGKSDIGQIQVRSVEGGFRYSASRRRLEYSNPEMFLSMRAPAPRGEVTVFTFNLYKQQDDAYWNYYQNAIPGPTILVYGRNLLFRDNSHLNQSPTPSWDWRN